MIVEQLFHLKINEQPYTSNYLLCDFFLKHRTQKDITLKMVMQETSISKSTITRFFPLVGCANFTQFMYEYQAEMENRIRRSRVILQNKESVSQLPKQNLDAVFTSFLQTIAKQVNEMKKLVVVGELRDILLAEPFLPHLFDLGIDCDVIWDMVGCDNKPIPKDAYYIILMSHYKVSDFLLKANEALAKPVRTLLEEPDYKKAIVAYDTTGFERETFLLLNRNLKPIDKKIMLLSLFGELHNQILYNANT